MNGREIQTKEELLSVIHLLKTKREKESLKNKWDHLIPSKLGGIDTTKFDKHIDQEIPYRLIKINDVIEKKELLDRVKHTLSEFDLSISSTTYEEIKFKTQGDINEYNSIKQELEIFISNPLNIAIEEKEISELKSKQKSSLRYLKKLSSNSDFNDSLYSAFKRSDSDCTKYGEYYDKLQKLHSQSQSVSKLKDIISRVSETIPNFAEDLLERKVDEKITSITDLENTWKASYLDFKLNERNSINPIKIQDRLNGKKDDLERLNSELIQKLSIKHQLSRITPQQHQALRGFVIAQNKITKSGRGKRDATLRKESRNQMKECRSSVPVWIMPLSKVMDNFTIGEDVFDVLIIDEASQADITNLPIFSIAKKSIVVGDDKQVSPRAAGIPLDGIDELINEHLEGIPNKSIYDYKASLYDIACSSFGETIRLSEHFRCTPEIIQFCNDLQYQGEIKALRESSDNPTPPSLVPFYVEGRMDESKINYEEAIKIASIAVAMTKNKKYTNSTIGVISLLGNRQHQYIDELLRRFLSTIDYEKHKILCGKASQFQGDERNIVFLSIVESPVSEGPLRMKSAIDNIRKEYNVAVSRAKDQLWIMHSMSPERHLQSEDIRFRLLKHAKDPRDLIDKYSNLTVHAESEFEKSIHEVLLREGYHFKPQYKVGAYRIDIVLFSSDEKKIALECDGNRYHHTEEQIRNDLERQSVLERLGYVFIRIRGSDFYRRREKTIKQLYKKLDELEALKGNKNIKNDNIRNEIDNDLIKEAEEIRKDIENQLE